MQEHDPDVVELCATAYLEHVGGLGHRMEALREQIVRKRSAMTLTGSPTREAVGGSAACPGLDEAVAALESLIGEYASELAGYACEQRDARRVISGLSDPRAARAITMHYLSWEPWDAVCRTMGYSKSRLMEIRKGALPEVYALMPEEWRRFPPNAMPV